MARDNPACLSKHGDQLSQWRAYGRPRGFSIGFDSEVLRGLCPLNLTFDQPSVREVCYDPAVQDGTIIDRFRFVRAQLASSGRPELAQPDLVGNIFMREAILLAPAFKDPAFAEEAEVRLQIFHDPTSGVSHDLKFRNGAMGLTPYLEIGPQGTAEREDDCHSGDHRRPAAQPGRGAPCRPTIASPQRVAGRRG